VAPTALEELAGATGETFSNILEARALTKEELERRSQKLAGIDADDDATIVLMGSWGRRELTPESDDDFMVLVDGAARDSVKPAIEDVRSVLTHPPSENGPFGSHVFSDDLVNKIGLHADDVDNMTRRMLFVLESVPATNVDRYRSARERVLRRYVNESVKDYRVPRFFLNDCVRYWRQMCVDFAGKEYEASKKWGLQNAKLRLSRKLLFASGLLPILEAAKYTKDEMFSFLDAELSDPPTDRIARSFVRHDVRDAGARTLTAYDEFLGLLTDPEWRNRVKAVTRETADQSSDFAQIRDLGKRFGTGLESLLFESDLLMLIREVGIF
jgi:hypothetical protein